MALEKEQAAYTRELPKLLGAEGKYVRIQDVRYSAFLHAGRHAMPHLTVAFHSNGPLMSFTSVLAPLGGQRWRRPE